MRDFINNLGNLFVPLLLRSPLHMLISGNILLITFTGRKSGKIYSTPVQYIRDGDTLTLFTQQGRVWWRNLRGSAPVEVLMRGKSLKGTASTITLKENETLLRVQMAKFYARMSDDWRNKMIANVVMIQIQVAA